MLVIWNQKLGEIAATNRQVQLTKESKSHWHQKKDSGITGLERNATTAMAMRLRCIVNMVRKREYSVILCQKKKRSMLKNDGESYDAEASALDNQYAG